MFRGLDATLLFLGGPWVLIKENNCHARGIAMLGQVEVGYKYPRTSKYRDLHRGIAQFSGLGFRVYD